MKLSRLGAVAWDLRVGAHIFAIIARLDRAI
jgi:hypothetical protein